MLQYRSCGAGVRFPEFMCSPSWCLAALPASHFVILMEAQQTSIFAIGVYFVPPPKSLLVDSDCLLRFDLCHDESITRAKLF
jgi:hypothetical protein